jgi:hypothetical protein
MMGDKILGKALYHNPLNVTDDCRRVTSCVSTQPTAKIQHLTTL